MHFHGPKPERGLKEMGKCNVTALVRGGFLLNHIFDAYNSLFHQGICCDSGRTADWAAKTMKKLKAPI